jgi:hypothetical protein
MEKDPNGSEEVEETSEDGRDNMGNWLQENLRMLVSIVIVIAIAGGIYAYSKRTQAPSTKNEPAISQGEGEGKISVIGGETVKEEDASTEAKTEESTPPAEVQKPTDKTTTPPAEVQTSKETESSFMETAAKGDGTTKLARRALANYLEKNTDTSLSAEHKIFIEDYLRRQVSNGKLKIGDTREFSKDMIAKAIEKSKGLNDKQLKNLQKYAQKVPGL